MSKTCKMDYDLRLRIYCLIILCMITISLMASIIVLEIRIGQLKEKLQQYETVEGVTDE